MRTEYAKTTDGERVEILVPETDADLAELERRAKAGEVDDRLSLGDGRPSGPQPRSGAA